MIYFITDGTAVKIGRSDALLERMRDLQSGNPRNLIAKRIVQTEKIHDANDAIIESALHAHFDEYRIPSINLRSIEWFTLEALEKANQMTDEEIIALGKAYRKNKIKEQKLKIKITDVAVERLKNTWRIRKMYKGVRYSTTMDYKPTKEDACAIMAKIIQEDLSHKNNVAKEGENEPEGIDH